MDDKIGFGILTYLLISILIVGFLPDDLFTGSRYDSPGVDVSGSLNVDVAEIDNIGDQVSFISKIGTVLFVAWKIEGIPAFLGGLLAIINYLSESILIIWAYDKLRGI